MMPIFAVVVQRSGEIGTLRALGFRCSALLFALAMGFVGGFITAWRAARLKIIDCLRKARAEPA